MEPTSPVKAKGGSRRKAASPKPTDKGKTTPVRAHHTRVFSHLFVWSAAAICLIVAFGSLNDRLMVSAATFQYPSLGPPLGNIPVTIWNRLAMSNYQPTAQIEIDGSATVGGGVVAGTYYDASTSQTKVIDLGAGNDGQNVFYGVADYDRMSTGDYLLKLETRSASGDYTTRFAIGRDGNVLARGCAGASFVGITTKGGPTNNGRFPVSAVGSYYAANNKCDNAANGPDFVDSHVCTVQEILQSIKCSQTNDPIRTVEGPNAWINGGPPGYIAYADDCTGWTSSSNARYGRVWNFTDGTNNGNNTTGGTGTMTSCNTGGLPFACCK